MTRLLTAEELAERWRVPKSWVYAKTRAGEIREARRDPLAAEVTGHPQESGAWPAHACEATLRRLADRLEMLARGLYSADARLMARAMRDALREDGGDR